MKFCASYTFFLFINNSYFRSKFTRNYALKILYNIGIDVYAQLVRLASCFNPKAKLFHDGRKGLLKNIKESVNTTSPIIWVHCSSVGEFEQARPVIEWYKSEKPGFKILLTFFSPSGYEQYKKYALADWVFYLPLDKSSNVKEFISIVKPVKAIFVKYEFWYNYLTQLKKNGIPTYIISAIFRPSQHFFKWYGSFFREMLQCYTKLFVQDEQSVSLLKSAGVSQNVILSGDTRFDRVNKIASQSKDLPLIERFSKDRFVVVAGSSWEPDEELIAEVIKNFSKIKLILAPHEVSEQRVEGIKKLFSGKRVLVITDLEKQNIDDINFDADILIVNKYGILSSIYKYGKVAYVGGGFGVGIHNVLEAATYSVPVIFGPNYSKFKEARDLLKLGGAYTVSDKTQLYNIFNSFVVAPSEIELKGKISGKYVKDNLGATIKIITEIE